MSQSKELSSPPPSPENPKRSEVYLQRAGELMRRVSQTIPSPLRTRLVQSAVLSSLALTGVQEVQAAGSQYRKNFTEEPVGRPTLIKFSEQGTKLIPSSGPESQSDPVSEQIRAQLKEALINASQSELAFRVDQSGNLEDFNPLNELKSKEITYNTGGILVFDPENEWFEGKTPQELGLQLDKISPEHLCPHTEIFVDPDFIIFRNLTTGHLTVYQQVENEDGQMVLELAYENMPVVRANKIADFNREFGRSLISHQAHFPPEHFSDTQLNRLYQVLSDIDEMYRGRASDLVGEFVLNHQVSPDIIINTLEKLKQPDPEDLNQTMVADTLNFIDDALSSTSTPEELADKVDQTVNKILTVHSQLDPDHSLTPFVAGVPGLIELGYSDTEIINFYQSLIPVYADQLSLEEQSDLMGEAIYLLQLEVPNQDLPYIFDRLIQWTHKIDHNFSNLAAETTYLINFHQVEPQQVVEVVKETDRILNQSADHPLVLQYQLLNQNASYHLFDVLAFQSLHPENERLTDEDLVYIIWLSDQLSEVINISQSTNLSLAGIRTPQELISLFAQDYNRDTLNNEVEHSSSYFAYFLNSLHYWQVKTSVPSADGQSEIKVEEQDLRSEFVDQLTPEAAFRLIALGGVDTDPDIENQDWLYTTSFNLLYEHLPDLSSDQYRELVSEAGLWLEDYAYTLGRWGKLGENVAAYPEIFLPALQEGVVLADDSVDYIDKYYDGLVQGINGPESAKYQQFVIELYQRYQKAADLEGQGAIAFFLKDQQAAFEDQHVGFIKAEAGNWPEIKPPEVPDFSDQNPLIVDFYYDPFDAESEGLGAVTFFPKSEYGGYQSQELGENRWDLTTTLPNGKQVLIRVRTDKLADVLTSDTEPPPNVAVFAQHSTVLNDFFTSTHADTSELIMLVGSCGSFGRRTDLYRRGYTGPIISYQGEGKGYATLEYMRQLIDLVGMGERDWQKIDQQIGMRTWGYKLPHDPGSQVIQYQQQFIAQHQSAN